MTKRIRKGLLSAVVLLTVLITFSVPKPVAASTGVSGGNVSGTWDLAGSPYRI
jgi:hypothetical protein